VHYGWVGAFWWDTALPQLKALSLAGCNDQRLDREITTGVDVRILLSKH
jgi:hypothetical protein